MCVSRLSPSLSQPCRRGSPGLTWLVMMLTGRSAIDAFEPLQDRPQELLVFFRIAHVVDGKDDDRFNALFADPLRRDESRESA